MSRTKHDSYLDELRALADTFDTPTADEVADTPEHDIEQPKLPPAIDGEDLGVSIPRVARLAVARIESTINSGETDLDDHLRILAEARRFIEHREKLDAQKNTREKYPVFNVTFHLVGAGEVASICAETVESARIVEAAEDVRPVPSHPSSFFCVSRSS